MNLETREPEIRSLLLTLSDCIRRWSSHFIADCIEIKFNKIRTERERFKGRLFQKKRSGNKMQRCKNLIVFIAKSSYTVKLYILYSCILILISLTS